MTMSKDFKPLLAKDADFSLITEWTQPSGATRFVISPKYDGIRAIVIGGVVVSRKLIPIPNAHVQKLFGHLEHLDGELIVGSPNDPDCYNQTFSGVMSLKGEPDVRFYAFDHIERPDDDFCRRLIAAQTLAVGETLVVVAPQVGVHSEAEVQEMAAAHVEDGYEGSMLRLLDGPKSKYKFGRSTAKEGTLLKIKEFVDFEAEVIGVEEEMHNGNEATKDELGRTKRSSHAENKVGKGTTGKLVLKTLDTGVVFRARGRMNRAMLQDIWDRRDEMLGQLVKVRKMKHGEKDAPRHPRVIEVIGFRSPIDL